VDTYQDGKFVLDRLADETILEPLASLKRVAKHNVAEADRIIRGYFTERDDMEPVARVEFVDRARRRSNGTVCPSGGRVRDRASICPAPFKLVLVSIVLVYLKLRLTLTPAAAGWVAFAAGMRHRLVQGAVRQGRAAPSGVLTYGGTIIIIQLINLILKTQSRCRV